jgi:hypothetical protein
MAHKLSRPLLSVFFSSFHYLTAISWSCFVLSLVFFLSLIPFFNNHTCQLASVRRSTSARRASILPSPALEAPLPPFGVAVWSQKYNARMGSMAVADMTAADVTGPDLVVPKEEPLEDGFTSSSISSPEPEGDRGLTAQDAVPVQKRKGGRKPVSPLLSTPSQLYIFLDSA